ncbi:hypothetical protein J3A78_003507 [Streptomyces sp. PvR006]|uniref:DUF6093 family protein n=1 Tax=Streptomyces sp. PvR006 TaxID=2817860 RepID=UPI0027DCDFB8|nr:DUF6093 family protein [Streptomyces sp. PvR006]MBP2583029.1 hypothetical protein [Streptomyces sp. PvR006]
MNIDSVLAAGRRAAEQRMRDRIRLYEQGPDVFNREDGTTVPGETTTLYEGKARIEPVAQASGEDAQAGEREVRLLEYRVSVPWATELPTGQRARPGLRVEVLTSPDPRMAGLTLWVTGTTYADQATAWRLTTEDRS